MADPDRPVAVTMGDPAGIGPEIVVKAFADPAFATPAVVIGDLAMLSRAAGLLDRPIELRSIDRPDQARPGPGTIDVIAASDLPADLPVGRVEARAGAAAFAYVERAIGLALAGEVRAIATAPLHKESLRAAGLSYPGHTEILADLTGTSDYAMMLFNDELRVILVTIHMSMREALDRLTVERELKTIRIAARAVRGLGVEKPRVAVAGVNPHAGEGGLFGREDAEIVAPAIAQARREGIDASGPWPGDTVFMQARRGRFDIVVAQYHDQGLIPIKYLGIERGVNVTLGLPFIRTSVDHGTAFDIAGKGLASHASLIVAIEQAAAMSRSSGPSETGPSDN
jgi:4-hydroxythreonine-4-phosphate dehydrogenase